MRKNILLTCFALEGHICRGQTNSEHLITMQMLNSHKNFIKRHESTLSAQFIIENEAGTDSLGNFSAGRVITVGVSRSKLPVSQSQRRKTVVKFFSATMT